MSTSAILPAASSYSVDFTSPSATAGQLSVFNSILGQLKTAISGGDLTTAQTLFSALSALSPSSVTDSNVQGTFLSSIGTALNDGSVTEAQNALATYQSAVQSSTPATATPSTVSTAATANTIAANLIPSQIQLNLVTTLLGPSSTFGSNSDGTLSTTDANSLTSILNAAYGTSGSTSSSSAASSTAASSTATSTALLTSSATSTSSPSTAATPAATPYDTLVASIQASLADGNGTITPALAYLQASGNFINTTA